MKQLDDYSIDQLNEFSGFLSFRSSWVNRQIFKHPYKVLMLITGNQFGKTGSIAYQYVLRILGRHPIPGKNIVFYRCEERSCPNGHTYDANHLPSNLECIECGEEVDIQSGHDYPPIDPPAKCEVCGRDVRRWERNSRVFRFCSETLPGQSTNISSTGESAEVKNTQYPEFKKWLPPHLIKKDITFRNPSMLISDPYGGKDITIDFVSYNQSVQSTAGTQRASIWCDESPSLDFYEEQLPRLVSEDGDLVLTYTPADRTSWIFDELFEKARLVLRTNAICTFLSQDGDRPLNEEVVDSPYDYVVVMASTDDNPTLSKRVIDNIFMGIDDPDTLAIRRYGIFKQTSGRIFKEMDYAVHLIPGDKYMPLGIPYHWTHGRAIDYHPRTPWACMFMSISPEDEAFIWGELNISPERMSIENIAKEVSLISEDYKFRVELIDPLSKASQKHKDGKSVTPLDEFNDAMWKWKKEGVGTGGYFSSWDTKGEKGRDEIRLRLKNAKRVGTPYNNLVIEKGKPVRLKTIWYLDSCKLAAKYARQWRWEEWANSKDAVTKEDKNKPEQKWSHFNMCAEALFKVAAFKAPKNLRESFGRRPNYFQGSVQNLNKQANRIENG